MTQIIEINDIKYKKCTCKLHDHENPVPLELMGRRKSSKDGYSTWCKKCNSTYTKNNYPRKNYRLKRRLREGMNMSLWRGCKDNCKLRNIYFDLLPEDVIIPDTCPVFDIPLINDVSYLHNNGLKNPMGVDNYPTIDRFDPNIGYTKSNINIISWKANNLKSNATVEDLEKLLKWVKTKQKHLER